YTLLTIGDGLVAMIPAILISTAAGIIVTRVGGEEEGSHLGKDVGSQLTAYPRAIAIAAGMLIVLGLVPGLPAIPFMALGLSAGFGAYMMLRKEWAGAGGGLDVDSIPGDEPAAPGSPPPSAEPAPRAPINPDSELFIPVVTPIVLEVSD